MLTSNIKNSEWDINESIQAYFLGLFLLRTCEYKEEIFMSSCVMIVSEFSNRIEAIFSYQTKHLVEVCSYCLKKRKKKKQLKNKKILVAFK